MKAVIQRCASARVEVKKTIVGQIGPGLVVLLGVSGDDDEAVAKRLALKIAALRIFDDEVGRFAFSLRDIGGAVLVIPNFTICGDARKGTRPNFSAAAPPALADHLYSQFVKLLAQQEVAVQTGVFGASMRVLVDNDGPVTLVLEVVNPATNPRPVK